MLAPRLVLHEAASAGTPCTDRSDERHVPSGSSPPPTRHERRTQAPFLAVSRGRGGVASSSGGVARLRRPPPPAPTAGRSRPG